MKKLIATVSTGIVIGFVVALANAEEPADTSCPTEQNLNAAGDLPEAPGESGMNRPAEQKCPPTPRTQANQRAGKVPQATPRPGEGTSGNDPLHPAYPY